MDMTVDEIRARLRAADEKEFAALERSLAADQRKGVRKAVDTARNRLRAERDERERVASLYDFERSLMTEGADGLIVGLDEVGRGAVAGPLAVGAVVLAPERPIAGLNDSKQIKPETRAQIAEQIEAEAIAWAVEYVQPQDIDRDGMAASLRRAFSGALQRIQQQGVEIGMVLVDGNPLHIHKREVNVVKGDAKCASIAAASIIAKVRRDALMSDLAADYPAYGFDVNKGYATAQHIDAIRQQGESAVHRKSFCTSFRQETLF